MSLAGILATVVTALEANGVPFMLTGSVAAAAYGAGRATMDVDVVIQATTAQLESVVKDLDGPAIYVSREAALEALAAESMFNVVETETGWKADLIPCKARPFSQATSEAAANRTGRPPPLGRLGGGRHPLEARVGQAWQFGPTNRGRGRTVARGGGGHRPRISRSVDRQTGTAATVVGRARRRLKSRMTQREVGVLDV